MIGIGNGLINWICYHYHFGLGYFKFKYHYLSDASNIDICGCKKSYQQFPRSLHNQNWGLTGVYKQKYQDYLSTVLNFVFVSYFLSERVA